MKGYPTGSRKELCSLRHRSDLGQTYFHQLLESHVAMSRLGSCECQGKCILQWELAPRGMCIVYFKIYSDFLNVHFNNVTISWKSNFYIIIIYNLVITPIVPLQMPCSNSLLTNSCFNYFNGDFLLSYNIICIKKKLSIVNFSHNLKDIVYCLKK